MTARIIPPEQGASIVVVCIRCKRPKPANEDWYSNGWVNLPDVRWYACRECFSGVDGKRICWELAFDSVKKEP